MKKIYILLFTFLITTVSFGQVIVAEGFDYPDGSLVPNGGWANSSGAIGDLLVSSGQAVVQHGAPSEDGRLSFTSVSGDIYFALDFSVDDLGAPWAGTDTEYFAHMDFNARFDIVEGTSGGDFTVGISSSTSTAQAIWATDLTFGQTYRAIVKFDQVSGLAQLWIDPALSTDTSISGTEDGAATVSSFDLRQSDSAENETVRVDDLMIGQTFNDVLAFVASTDPAITITAPLEGEVFSPGTTSVNVSVAVQNFMVDLLPADGGTGDGHIHWTINGGSNMLKFDTNDEVIPVADGQSYTIFMKLVDNTHADIPGINATVNFSVGSATQVADLAALRADVLANGEGSFYELMSVPTVTYTRTNRNQKYVQDSSGAGILIDDSAGTITTTFAIGDGISGLIGQTSSFGAVLQFVPSVDASVVAGATVIPEVVDIATLLTNWEDYESELIKINSVTFADAGGTFASSTVYNISDPDVMAFRTNFSEADYIGQTIPAGANAMVVLVAEFNGTPQVVARSLSDLTLSVESFEATNFNVYPNPVSNGIVNITSRNNDAISVAIFDILGKQVISETVSNNNLNVSSLNAGIYIMKISQNGNSITKKLVVK